MCLSISAGLRILDGMNSLKFVLLTFVVSLVIWAVFSFPLPLYVSRGIPSSAWNIEKGSVKTMVPGDHLQMLYHYWLFREKISGKIGKENIYEFNYGKCFASYRMMSYFPFSLFWMIGALIGGVAFGYNFAQFLSIWGSVIFGWLFVCRYSSDFWTILASVVGGVIVPYRWAMLFGGSPTGCAMMWLPVVLLGLDIAIRDEQCKGGVIAGVAMLFISWGDKNTFLFCTFALPIFSILILLCREDLKSMKIKDFWRVIQILLIPAIFVLIAGSMLIIHIGSRIAESTMRQGREIREISIFSHVWSDIFSFSLAAKSGNVYVGFAGLAAIIAGLLLSPRTCGTIVWRVQYFLKMFLVLMSIALIIFIALGVNGPWNGFVLRAARKVVPYFKMIRQTSKVFCLLSPFFMFGICASLIAIFNSIQKRKIVWICAIALMIAMLIEYKGRVKTTVSLLVNKQTAYEYVTAESNENSEPAHALVIPIWPGDSHFSSPYLYYASLYRIKLVNGYSPLVHVEYINDVFKRFESINKGFVTDSQLNELLARKIRYIILHEDLFPEKVSPFAVSATLIQLLRHQRLKLLCQDGPVWAFKILDVPSLEPRMLPKWEFVSSARVWDLEKCNSKDTNVVKADDASNGEYLRIETIGGKVQIPEQNTLLMKELGWLVRMRGKAFLRYRSVLDDKLLAREPVEVNSSDWIWIYIPAGAREGYGRLGLIITLEEGSVDMDVVIFVASPWKSPSVGESIVFPACVMFHAGYTAPDQKSVILRKDWDSYYPVFYSPKLPLEVGTYEMEVEFSSEVRDRVEIAEFTLNPVFAEKWTPLVAGNKKTKVRFEIKNNLPVFMQLRFFRISDMQLHSIVLRKLDLPKTQM